MGFAALLSVGHTNYVNLSYATKETALNPIDSICAYYAGYIAEVSRIGALKEIFLAGNFVELRPQMPLNWELMLLRIFVFLATLLGRLVISLCINSKMPSHSVSIRAIETVKYQVIDKRRNEILEEIEESKAFFEAAWVPVPQSTKLPAAMNNLDFRAGLHAASHAVLNVVPLVFWMQRSRGSEGAMAE
ncbi:hypothetical protein FNV43_RR21002 [Rhamnella rubrinervis]|uniref:Uncharacterized protein n=1 Tax=Rhamnella rubrinervis TaxID=2594499 RepID=A0A8K0E0V5_9ROSA|nr:hypothetical protein FNV43_RR21002 [Rhamnella rubrinervis]